MGSAIAVPVTEEEGPDRLELSTQRRLVERGEIGRGVGGDVPAVNISHLSKLVNAHAARQPDLVGNHVGRPRGDAMALHEDSGGVVVAVVAVVEGDGDDAALRRGQGTQIPEPYPARGGVEPGDDPQPYPRHPRHRRTADDGARRRTIDGHPAPGTGAQCANVGGNVQAQTVLVITTKLEQDASDLPVVLGAEPQIPLAVGHVNARQGQVGAGGPLEVAGGGDLQRLGPTGVGGGVGPYGAGLGGKNPGVGVLHVRQHRLSLPQGTNNCRRQVALGFYLYFFGCKSGRRGPHEAAHQETPPPCQIALHQRCFSTQNSSWSIYREEYISNLDNRSEKLCRD